VTPQIRAVIRKELREFRRNKFVVGTMIVLPLLFLLIPIGNVLAIGDNASFNVAKATVGGALLTFLIVPLILPTTIAAYAVIGERDQGTLEPVLTTPVTREELLLGKALAELVPTVVVAYSLFTVFLFVVRVFASHAVVDLVWDGSSILTEVIAVPLLAAFSIWVGIAISTRSGDVRVAQQLSGLAMLPMLGLVALITFRVIEPSLGLAVGVALFLSALDLLGWRFVSQMFDRERLLTRYRAR